MTVASTTSKARFTGNGATVVFPASIKIFADTDFGVTTINNTTDVLVNTLILNDGGALGYTVVFDTEAETLTVTVNTAPTSAEDLQILRALPQTQTTDFPRATKFPAESNENALDKNILILQDQQEQLDRAFVLPEESSATNPSLPNPSSRRALIWDPSEDGTIINSTNDPDEAGDAATAAAASAAAASTSESNAATSETNAAADAVLAQAAVGGVRVSANDTTADNLETKLLVGTGLSLSTQNDGGNETRTVDIDINGLTSATITAADEIIFSDVDDSNDRKKDTIQGILDLITSAGLILLATATASNSATVDFASFIDSTHDEYQFHYTNVVPVTDNVSFLTRTSTDGGSTFDSSAGNYGWNYRQQTISSGTVGTGDNSSDTSMTLAELVGNDANSAVSGFVTLFNPAGTNNTAINSRTLSQNAASSLGNYRHTTGIGIRKSAANVDAFRFLMSSGNISTGDFKLYGVKKS